MKLFRSIAEMKTACRDATTSGKTLGLVPTMGALHDGHMSLVRASTASCDVTAVTVYVNPLQFGPTEDLDKYPRTLEQDLKLLERAGVDYVFAPSADEMYPAGAKTFVLVEELSDKLDGGSRPGHFRGVATVVAKLFEIVRPNRAFFGQKDAAQVAVLRKMVCDLNLDVEVVVCPIVRERDGLAMSSRNAYLGPEHRRQALVLSRALQNMQALVDQGEQRAERLIDAGKRVIEDEREVRLDYLAVVDPDTLDPVPDVSRGALIAVAAYVGPTRLIDNLLLTGATAELQRPSRP